MIWVVALEAAAICVLTLVVIALVHSYAGLAARVEATATASATDERDERGAPAEAARGALASTVVGDLSGVTPDGEQVLLAISSARHDTLLAFLSTSCASCGSLWDELGEARRAVLPPDVRLVVVAKGADRESPALVADLAAGGRDVDVVMSSEAWVDFDVPGSPYFVLVGRGGGHVLGQGTARSWPQVMGLIDVASGDERLGARTRKSRRDRRQELDVDRVLLDAGVLPGDPSLYPVPGDATGRA